MSPPGPRVLVLDRSPELASRVRQTIVGAGAVVTACPDPARASAHLAAAHWDVIVAGPSLMHRGGLRRLGSLHQRYPWVSIVLALHERPRADLAEIVQAGADDLVPLHADDDELRGALARAARITRGRLGVLAHRAPAGVGSSWCRRPRGVAGRRSWPPTPPSSWSGRPTQPVVLLDLDLQFGEVSTALRLRPDVTITDALTAEAEGHDLDEVLDGCLIDHPDGFKVLAAPRAPGRGRLDHPRRHHPYPRRPAGPPGLGRHRHARRAGRPLRGGARGHRPRLRRRHAGPAQPRESGPSPRRPGPARHGRREHLRRPQQGRRRQRLDLVAMAAELGRPFEAIVPYSRDVSRSVNIGVPADRREAEVAHRQGPDRQRWTTVLPGNRKPAPARLGPSRSRRRRPWPGAAAGRRPVPGPAPDPVEPTAAGPDGESTEIDLTEHQPRACPSTARARPVSRCRWSTDVPMGDRCRGRGPPRPPHDLWARPAGKGGGRRLHRLRCGLRPPLPRPEKAPLDGRSILPDSHPSLVPSTALKWPA